MRASSSIKDGIATQKCYSRFGTLIGGKKLLKMLNKSKSLENKLLIEHVAKVQELKTYCIRIDGNNLE